MRPLSRVKSFFDRVKEKIGNPPTREQMQDRNGDGIGAQLSKFSREYAEMQDRFVNGEPVKQ